MTERSAAAAKFASNTSSKTVEQAMSVRKLTASLLTALMMFGGAASVRAQEHVPPADPFAFDPDFRWFEPVYDMDLADMKPSKRANTGWYATYDRLNLYGSRPETSDPSASEEQLDSGWGDRYQVGYMLADEDNGWMFTYTDMGVGKFHRVRRQRLSNTIDEGEDPLADAIFTREEPLAVSPYVDILDSQNVFSFDSFELNKTWRLEPYHYGGILEPMVGVRWIRLEDVNAFQTFSSVVDLDEVPFTTFGGAEQLITNTSLTENEMIAGQVGFRYFKFRDRFTYSADFRVFSGASLQQSKAVRHTEITIYEVDIEGDEIIIPVGAPPIHVIDRETEPVYAENDEFMIGFDLKGELGYQLTKDISIRAGFQLVDVATGVWRGGTGELTSSGDQDQDLVMFGGTFGLTLNR